MADNLQLQNLKPNLTDEFEYSKTENLNSLQCSCTECNESDCFAKRHQSQFKCTCGQCKSINTCLFCKDLNLIVSESKGHDASKKISEDAKSLSNDERIIFSDGKKFDYPVLSSFITGKNKYDSKLCKTDGNKDCKINLDETVRRQIDKSLVSCETDENKQEQSTENINKIEEKKPDSDVTLSDMHKNEPDDGPSFNSPKFDEKKLEAISISPPKINEMKQDRPYVTCKNIKEKHNKSAFVSRKTEEKKYGRPILTCNINKKTNNDSTPPLFSYNIEEKKSDTPELPIGKIHKNMNNRPKPNGKRIHIPKYTCKTDSIKSETSNKYEGAKNNSKYTHKVKSIVVDGTERIEKEIVYEADQNITTETLTHSKYSLVVLPKPDQNKIAACAKATSANPSDFETMVHSATVSYSRTGLKPSTHLSAQIMDVPLNDFKNSISINKSTASPNTNKSLTRYDILKRIKEAYKACSCNICKCITNIVIPDQNEVCNCKPCECSECRTYRNETKTGTQGKRMLQPTSASETFKNNLKKLLSERKSGSCDCNRCDCLECTTFNSKTCDCQPCECTECKTLSLQRPRTYIVATVAEDVQRNVCTCEPCACFQCGNVYGSVARNTTHEMSTGINRHQNCHCDSCFNDDCEQEGVYTCNCDRHKKIIRKPVQADNHDFDIRTAKVSTTRNRISATRGLTKPKKLNDQVTMYTALTSSYKPEENLFDTGCVCEVCDCMVCECQDKIHKLSQHYASLKKVPKSSNILVSCDCKPCCECQICNKYNRDLLVSTTHQDKINIPFSCKCETCECIQCKKFDGPSVVSSEITDGDFYNKRHDSHMDRVSCDCRPCECIDCQKIPGNYLGRSMDHDNANINAKIEEHCKFPVYDRFEPDNYIDRLLTNSDSVRNHNANRALYFFGDSPRISAENMYINYDFPENSISYTDNPNQRFEKQGPSTSKERNVPNLNTNKSKTISYGMYLQNENQPTSIHFDVDKKSSSFTSSYESAMSSGESLCKGRLRSISCIKDTVKSWESCNSSGHDYSDYLITFPRATVDNCINDVMNLDKKLNISHLNTDVDYKNDLSDCDKLKTNMMNRNTSKSFASGHILYAKMSSKGYINEDCDYETSTLKQIKCSRCRCDFGGGKYWGSSFIDKRADYMSENETTQTLLKLIDRGAYNEVNNNMDFYLRPMNEQRTSPLFATSQELLVTRDTSSTLLLSNKNTVQDISNERHAIERNSCKLPNYIKDNTRKVNINYRCVTNTIREARAFTMELLRILDKYEKANENFESVFEKLKKSHETILYDLLQYPNYDSSKVKSSKDLREEPQPQKDCDEVIDKYIHIKDVYNINKTDEKGDTNTDSKNVDAIQEEVIQGIVIFSTEKPIKIKLEECNQSKEKNTLTTLNQFDNNKIDCHKILHNKQTCRKYKKMIKRAACVIRKTCLKTGIANESKMMAINITTPIAITNIVAQTDAVEQITKAIQIQDTNTDGITKEKKDRSYRFFHIENDMVKNYENIQNIEIDNIESEDILDKNKIKLQERQNQNTTEVYCLAKIQERCTNFIEESEQGNDEIFEEALEFNDSNELTKPVVQNPGHIFTFINQNSLDKVNEINETYDPRKGFCYKTLQLMRDIQEIEKDFFQQADMIRENVKLKPKICLSTHIDTTSEVETRTKMSKEALKLDTTHKHLKISKRSLELQDTASINTLTTLVIRDSKKKVKEYLSYYNQNPPISNLKEDISNKLIKLSKRSLEIDENLNNNTCKQTKEELYNKIFEVDDAETNLEAIKYCTFEYGNVEKQHEPEFSEHCIKIHEGEENPLVFIKTIKSDNIIKPKDNKMCDEMRESNTGLPNSMIKVEKRLEDHGLIQAKDRENKHISQSHSFSAGTSSYSKSKDLRASPTTVLKTTTVRRIEDVEGSNVVTKSDLMFSLSFKQLQTSKSMQTSERAERTVDDKQIDVEATLKRLKEFASSPILNQNKTKRMRSPSEEISKGNNTGSVSTCNSICDAMKISFDSVRRVSDHTVIVKWNIPSSTKGILGYELLVDGRAVQKILSPTRCLAVVTCLPRVPRLLLTVRTITAAATDRYPTATIVYHPRV